MDLFSPNALHSAARRARRARCADRAPPGPPVGAGHRAPRAGGRSPPPCDPWGWRPGWCIKTTTAESQRQRWNKWPAPISALLVHLPHDEGPRRGTSRGPRDCLERDFTKRRRRWPVAVHGRLCVVRHLFGNLDPDFQRGAEPSPACHGQRLASAGETLLPGISWGVPSGALRDKGGKKELLFCSFFLVFGRAATDLFF
eukprot:gene499-biopygen19635